MKYIVVITIVLLVFSAKSIAQNNVKYNADKTASYVTYSMSHPMHDWDGTSKNVLSVLLFNPDSKQITKVAVSIPVSTFDSQNANRDSHMIEVVDGIKNPAVTFSSTSVTTDGNKIVATGDMVFHGVTKQVTINATYKINGQIIEVTGDFAVKMSDFKIESPSLMGMPTKDDIKLKLFVVYKQK